MMKSAVAGRGRRWNLLAGDSPIGDFVSALGRETMILHEISNDRYLHSPTIEYMRIGFRCQKSG